MVPVTHGQLWQSHHSPQEAEMVGTRQSLPPHGSWEVPMGTGGAEDTPCFVSPPGSSNEVAAPSLSPSLRVRDVTLWSQHTEMAVKQGGGSGVTLWSSADGGGGEKVTAPPLSPTGAHSAVPSPQTGGDTALPAPRAAARR